MQLEDLLFSTPEDQYEKDMWQIKWAFYTTLRRLGLLNRIDNNHTDDGTWYMKQ